MSIYYDTITLLAALEITPKFKSFLKDRYFPTDPSTDIFPTEKVLIEILQGRRRLAPVVMPRKGGVSVERESATMREYVPPTVAPQRPITMDDLNTRLFGETLFGDKTPAQREAELMGRDLSDLTNMIVGREEYIAAQTLQNNGCILRQYADVYGSSDYEEWEVRFYEDGNNTGRYVPATSWNGNGLFWLEDLGAMVRILKRQGNPAEDVLIGANAFESLLKNEEFKSIMDNRRIHLGEVDPTEGSDGAVFYGSVIVNGTRLNLIGYEEQYEDEVTGELKPFIDPDSVTVTAPGAGHGLYGAITQKEEDGQSYTYPSTLVPKVIVDQESDSTILKVRSRPIFAPKTTCSWVSSKVIF